MKLIGRKTERDYRAELLASNKAHFSGESPSRLNEALRNGGYETKNAYVLQWTPDQAEDFFTVLVEGQFVVAVEINRCDVEGEVCVKRYELADYIKGLSRMHHVRLLVAQALAHGKT